MAERIVIVGAGPAGMRAAEVLAVSGARPVVLDEAPASGGQIYRRQPDGFTRGYDTLYGFEADKARRLHRAFDALGERIEHRPGSLVWGIEGRHLLVLRDGLGESVPFDRLLLATGAMDRVIPLPGWTLPGVYTLGGAQVALKHQGCAIGRRVSVYTLGGAQVALKHQGCAIGGASRSWARARCCRSSPCNTRRRAPTWRRCLIRVLGARGWPPFPGWPLVARPHGRASATSGRLPRAASSTATA
jgi:NADPH-dependent 2,4-dienoyl-CoA reductase/sulfur reductase-like enzyme